MIRAAIRKEAKSIKKYPFCKPIENINNDIINAVMERAERIPPTIPTKSPILSR